MNVTVWFWKPPSSSGGNEPFQWGGVCQFSLMLPVPTASEWACKGPSLQFGVVRTLYPYSHTPLCPHVLFYMLIRFSLKFWQLKSWHESMFFVSLIIVINLCLIWMKIKYAFKKTFDYSVVNLESRKTKNNKIQSSGVMISYVKSFHCSFTLLNWAEAQE